MKIQQSISDQIAWAVLMIFIMGGLACTREYKDPISNLNLKTGVAYGQMIYPSERPEIIPLHDNTFWIHYPHYGQSNLSTYEHIEHYDMSFHLLDSASFRNYDLGKFVIRGNNDIVAPAMYYYLPNSGFYRFVQFNNRAEITAIDTSLAISDSLAPWDTYIGSYTCFARQSNGRIIFGCHTYNFTDSIRIIMAAYNDPISSAIPSWVNKDRHFDVPNGIYGTSIVDMAVDDENNVYVLATTGNYIPIGYYALRKHDQNGKLVWQKRISRESISGPDNFITIEKDRVLVGTSGRNLIAFDKNGEETKWSTPFLTNQRFFKDTHSNGYIALSDSVNRIGSYAVLWKLDASFKPLKHKILGNQGTKSPCIAKMDDGTFILAAYVEMPDIHGYNLALYHINNDLEFVK
jgi:hypothetical protein